MTRQEMVLGAKRLGGMGGETTKVGIRGETLSGETTRGKKSGQKVLGAKRLVIPRTPFQDCV